MFTLSKNAFYLPYGELSDTAVRYFLRKKWDKVEDGIGCIYVYSGEKKLMIGDYSSAITLGKGRVEVGDSSFGWFNERPSYLTLFLFLRKIVQFKKVEQKRRVEKLKEVLSDAKE